MKNVLILAVALCSIAAQAVVPRYNIDPYSHWYTAEQTFAGGIVVSGALEFSALSDVSGDAMCISAGSVVGTCAAAVFTTSVSSPIILSPATGSADDILIKPAGTTAATFAETSGNLTIVGDLIASGNDLTATNMKSAVTGGADDITFQPGGATALTLAETTGDATLVGDLVVTGDDITSLNYKSAVTGGADDMTFQPGGATAFTLAETTGNGTLVGDLTVSGGDITAINMSSAATGSADDMSFKPATVAVLNVAEAGEIQMMKKVTSHAACAAVGDLGRIELFGVADTVNLCVCVQTAAATFAWTAIPAGGAC